MGREEFEIFSSGRIGKLKLNNRLIRSATCDYQMAPDGTVTDIVLDIYKRLAEGGSGLIITGLMAISPNAKGTDGQACIYDDDLIPEVARIANAVHHANSTCPVIAQLCHPGRQLTHENNTAECVSSSEIPSPLLVKKARALTTFEVESIIRDFANAVVRIKKAGFDGVQLHGAHGYLLSSFLSPYTNHRTDQFGGSAKKRVRIIREIVVHARAEVGDFPIMIKMNCDDHVVGGITGDSFPELAMEIAEAGVDAIEVSGGIWDCLARSEEELGFFPVPIPESRTRIDAPERQSYYYRYIKSLQLPIPLILVGGNRNIEHMETLMKEDRIDFFSLSRPLICEPNLPDRWLKGVGSANASCVSCNACMLFKDEFGCALRRKKLKRAEFEEAFANGWRAAFK